MKFINLLIIFILLTSVSFAQSYRIDWWVISSGGGHSQSGSYQLDGTIGQPIVGQSYSPNYRLGSGFWVGVPAAAPACDYTVGDANNSHSFNGLDVTYSVTYFKGGPPPPYTCECPPHGTWYVSGDVNGSCSYNGLDITYGVTYFKGGPGPLPCPDCPPGVFLAPPASGIEPSPAVRPVVTPTLNIKPKADSAE